MARLNNSNVVDGDEDSELSRHHASSSQPVQAPSGQPRLATARQQRPLKLQHVDSLLLKKLSSPPRSICSPVRQVQSSQNGIIPRTTPARKTKHPVKYESQDDSPEDELVDSAWKYSDGNSSDDGSVDNGDSEGFLASPIRTYNSQPREPFFHHPSGLGENGQYVRSKKPGSKPLGSNFGQENSYGSRPASFVSCTSASDESGAILRFSPQRSKSPFKKRPPSRPSTPTPPESPAKSTLTSPRKLQKIPPTPHRPSTDAFWNAELINTWNDEYSPRKTPKSSRNLLTSVRSDDKETFTPRQKIPGTPAKNGADKDRKMAAESKKIFERSKHSVAESFLQELDSKISKGEIGQLAASTGGVKLIWNKKLNSTAGRAHWRRDAGKSAKPVSADCRTLHEAEAWTGEYAAQVSYRHYASIELAEKVIDDDTRLLNVLAHEYCHLANFMISGVKDQPHGASFKGWAALVTKEFAGRDVVVTTKHTYEIKYKYAWACCNSECGVEYARHSRSVDPKKHTCGKCRGRLQQVRPIPRKGGSAIDAQGVRGGNTEYQRFVKEQFGVVRAALGQRSPMKDIMTELGARYRTAKAEMVKKDEDATISGTTAIAEGVKIIQLDGSDDYYDGVHEADARSRVENDGHEDVDKVSRLLDFITLRDD